MQLIKELSRQALLPLLHTPLGQRTVQLGLPSDQATIKLAWSPFGDQRLGLREIEGYLQHYIPAPGDVVVNAGAYHGHLALYLAHKVGPTGTVLCFEPDATNRRVLQRNLKLNAAQNIRVIPRGLWSHQTTLSFSTRGSSSRVHANGLSNIPLIDLDTALAEQGLNQVDFIAMDIEGAEIEAIQGMTKTLEQSPQLKLAIASYHVVNGHPTHQWLEQHFAERGWWVATGFPQHLTTYAQQTPPVSAD